MSIRQPRHYHSAPNKAGKRYRNRKKRQHQKGNSIGTFLGGAAMLGLLAGAGTVAVDEGGLSSVTATAKTVAVSLGIMRARSPQPGDYWPGCNAARAAGTAPIYRGEPGYREGMDGDSDGIACEPYR